MVTSYFQTVHQEEAAFNGISDYIAVLQLNRTAIYFLSYPQTAMKEWNHLYFHIEKSNRKVFYIIGKKSVHTEHPFMADLKISLPNPFYLTTSSLLASNCPFIPISVDISSFHKCENYFSQVWKVFFTGVESIFHKCEKLNTLRYYTKNALTTHESYQACK